MTTITISLKLLGFPPFFAFKKKKIDRNLEAETSIYKWVGSRLGDSKALHERWLFKQTSLGGGSNISYVHPKPWGPMIQFDEHIFQMGGRKPPTS